MAGLVFDLLKETGGSTVDEILTSVPVRPETLSDDLRELMHSGYITVRGPKTIEDFDGLVARVRKLNGYEYDSKDGKRSRVLREILEHETEFTRTMVRLSTPGYVLALR